MVPGIYHLRAPALQHLLYGFLHHLHIVRLNACKPVPVARLRPDFVRHAQEDPHGPVRVHSRRAAVLQLNCPDSGPGALQNILQAPPGLQLIFFLLLYHHVHVPQGENRAVLRRRLLRGGKMELQVLQPPGAVLHLVPDGELFLAPEPGEHIALLCHRAEPLLVPGDHARGNIPLHSRRVALLKTGRPIHAQPFAAAVNLALARVEVHLIDAQVVHAEGVEHGIAPLLELPDQVAPLQGGYNKIRRGLEHVRRVLQRPHGGIVHAVKADDPFAVIQGNHHQGVNPLPLQVLILKRVRLPNILQAFNDDMLADAELPVPACAHLRGDVLEALLFRLHPVGRPFVGVVVAAGLVLLEYIRPLPVQRLPQMLQQHLQGLIRRFLQQGNAKALVDDGLQILNAAHAAVLLAGPGSRSALPGPFQTFPYILHMSVLHTDRYPAIVAAAAFHVQRRFLESAVSQCRNSSALLQQLHRRDQKICVIIPCTPRSCQ